MNKNKIWLSPPHMGGEEQQFIQSAFDSNWLAPLGPNVNGLETDLQNYLDNNVYVAALSSGTAAIHLGLLLLGVGVGDEVICQSMTFAASANPIKYLGAHPVFVDSERDTWNMCPHMLEEAIIDRMKRGKKPKAIIAVHLYGMPFNVPEIVAIAAKYDIPVLEDSAEALGSTYKGQKCGTFGDVGVFSFNGNKIITTSGGGAIVLKSEKAKDRATFLATQAKENAVYYQHCEIGYNYRMSNICAGIGRGQMLVLDEHVRLRRDMYFFYEELFSGFSGISILKEPSHEYFSNRWLSTITVNPEMTGGVTSEDLWAAFENENIESRPLWKPMHLQPVYRDCPFYGTGVSESLFQNGLCLPSGSSLGFDDKERILNVFRDVFKGVLKAF